MTMTSLRFALVLMFTSGFVDAYTYMERGGVFANAQTGNVILGAIDVSAGSYEQAMQHLASVLAFAAGVVIAVRLKAVRASEGLRAPGLVALALYAGSASSRSFRTPPPRSPRRCRSRSRRGWCSSSSAASAGFPMRRSPRPAT